MPPGPVRVSRRVDARRTAASAQLRLAADEARQLRRQVVGPAVERPDRREVGLEAVDRRAGRSAPAGGPSGGARRGPRIATPSGSSSATSDGRRLGQQDLAAVTGAGDPRRPMDVGADVLAVGVERAVAACGGPSGRAARRRRARAPRRVAAGRRRRRGPRPTAARTRRRSRRPRSSPRGRRPTRSPDRISSRCRARRSVQRSPRRAWASRVEPSMSVNRNVTVPMGFGAHERGGSLVSDAAAPSRTEGGRRARGGSRGRASGCSRSACSKSQLARARQRVGSVATTWATRGRPSSTDSSPKNSPGPQDGQLVAVADDADGAIDDEEEAGPDLALPGDHVVGRKLDLDRPLGDRGEVGRRRPRRTAGRHRATRSAGPG